MYIYSEPPSSMHARVTILPTRELMFGPQPEYQADNKQLYAFWDGFADLTGIYGYETRLVSDSSVVSNWTSTGQHTNVLFSNLSLSDGYYSVEVRAINQGNISSIAVNRSMHITMQKPSFTGM